MASRIIQEINMKVGFPDKLDAAESALREAGLGWKRAEKFKEPMKFLSSSPIGEPLPVHELIPDLKDTDTTIAVVDTATGEFQATIYRVREDGSMEEIQHHGSMASLRSATDKMAGEEKAPFVMNTDGMKLVIPVSLRNDQEGAIHRLSPTGMRPIERGLGVWLCDANKVENYLGSVEEGRIEGEHIVCTVRPAKGLRAKDGVRRIQQGAPVHFSYGCYALEEDEHGRIVTDWMVHSLYVKDEPADDHTALRSATDKMAGGDKAAEGKILVHLVRDHEGQFPEPVVYSFHKDMFWPETEARADHERFHIAVMEVETAEIARHRDDLLRAQGLRVEELPKPFVSEHPTRAALEKDVAALKAENARLTEINTLRSRIVEILEGKLEDADHAKAKLQESLDRRQREALRHYDEIHALKAEIAALRAAATAEDKPSDGAAIGRALKW